MIIITQFKSRFQAARASRASAKLLVSVGLFVRSHAALQEMVENVGIVVSTPKRGIEIVQPPPHAHDSGSDLNWPRCVSAIESKIFVIVSFLYVSVLFCWLGCGFSFASVHTHSHAPPIFFLMKRASSVSFALLFLLRVSLSSRSQSNKQQKAYCRKRFLVVV